MVKPKRLFQVLRDCLSKAMNILECVRLLQRWGLWIIFSVGAQMAGEANLHSDCFWAVRAWNIHVGSNGDLFLLFLSSLRYSATAVPIASQVFALFWIAKRHSDLSHAVHSHEAELMLKAFSETIRVSLTWFFWLPRECFSCWSSPYSSFFGRWSSDMRRTWPSQRSCDCIRIVFTNAG